MNNIVEVNISDIHKAEYNPRYISDERIETLRESIATLGMIKPVIIRKEDKRILAGHQRSRALAAMGKTTCPAFVLNNVNSSDEVRFNQLHNLSECEITDRAPHVVIDCSGIPFGRFVLVENSSVTLLTPGEKNQAVNQLSKMILKYGQFGNAVIDESGNVIVSAVYAKAVKLIGQPLWVYRIKDADLAKHYFSQDYGVFSYKHIEKHTYIQCLAQKYRLRGDGMNRTASTLYNKLVIPFLEKQSKTIKILDFGAGQRDYAKFLQKEGYNVHPIEFFLRKPGKDVIWMEEILRNFSKIETQLSFYGQYDVVVCDSVLNSVDSLEAQFAVLKSLSALCKPNGHIFWSGIPLKFKQKHIDRKATYDNKESSAFLDEHGFTGNFRYGEWYFQKYHTTKEVIQLTKQIFGNTFKLFDRGTESNLDTELYGSSFQVHVINEKLCSENELKEALRFEFSLPLPKGNRHQLADRLLRAYEKSLNYNKVDNKK